MTPERKPDDKPKNGGNKFDMGWLGWKASGSGPWLDRWGGYVWASLILVALIVAITTTVYAVWQVSRFVP